MIPTLVIHISATPFMAEYWLVQAIGMYVLNMNWYRIIQILYRQLR